LCRIIGTHSYSNNNNLERHAGKLSVTFICAVFFFHSEILLGWLAELTNPNQYSSVNITIVTWWLFDNCSAAARSHSYWLTHIYIISKQDKEKKRKVTEVWSRLWERNQICVYVNTCVYVNVYVRWEGENRFRFPFFAPPTMWVPTLDLMSEQSLSVVTGRLHRSPSCMSPFLVSETTESTISAMRSSESCTLWKHSMFQLIAFSYTTWYIGRDKSSYNASQYDSYANST